jgi:hypothetical protein
MAGVVVTGEVGEQRLELVGGDGAERLAQHHSPQAGANEVVGAGDHPRGEAAMQRHGRGGRGGGDRQGQHGRAFPL